MAITRTRGSRRRGAGAGLCALAALACAQAKGPEPLAARVIFHLQDPVDGMCFGPNGFAACDVSTLWTVGMAKGRQSIVSFLHPTEEASCLERVPVDKVDSRVRLASCKAKNSINWNIKTTPAGTSMVSADDKHCIARKWNFATMQPCEFGYTPLAVVESSLHDRGFLLATRDGTCFDGVRFRICDPKDAKLYWGAAVRFDSPKGEGYYSFFKFHILRTEPGQKCLVKDSAKRVAPTALGDCSHSGAKNRAMLNGKLTQDKGKTCLKRDDKTGAGKMQPCKDGGTPIQWTLPDDRSMRW